MVVGKKLQWLNGKKKKKREKRKQKKTLGLEPVSQSKTCKGLKDRSFLHFCANKQMAKERDPFSSLQGKVVAGFKPY